MLKVPVNAGLVFNGAGGAGGSGLSTLTLSAVVDGVKQRLDSDQFATVPLLITFGGGMTACTIEIMSSPEPDTYSQGETPLASYSQNCDNGPTQQAIQTYTKVGATTHDVLQFNPAGMGKIWMRVTPTAGVTTIADTIVIGPLQSFPAQ